MKAELLFRRRTVVDEAAFTELVLWRVPSPVRGSGHAYKYSLAFVVRGVCVLRYDNEAGKGDHKHIGEIETEYAFTDVDTLLADFKADVVRWLDEHRDA
jgi:hypothetical protein